MQRRITGPRRKDTYLHYALTEIQTFMLENLSLNYWNESFIKKVLERHHGSGVAIWSRLSGFSFI